MESWFDSVSAPPAGQKANQPPLTLIEDRIPLLWCFLPSDPQHVANMHQKDDLSFCLLALLGFCSV